MSRRILAAAAALTLSISIPAARAAETGGCESFAWPLATEIAWMTSADSAAVKSGDKLDVLPAKAMAVSLLPSKDISYPVPPTGKKKESPDGDFGAVLEFANVGEAGVYQVSLSGKGWIDVIQGGQSLKAKEHTGKSDCDSLRKSVRFELVKGPLTIELSGVPATALKLTIRKAD